MAFSHLGRPPAFPFSFARTRRPATVGQAFQPDSSPAGQAGKPDLQERPGRLPAIGTAFAMWGCPLLLPSRRPVDASLTRATTIQQWPAASRAWSFWSFGPAMSEPTPSPAEKPADAKPAAAPAPAAAPKP